MLISFPPVEPPQAKLLILGTMPSVRSLEKFQYYGHPQNQFWRLLFALWGLPAPGSYEQRITFLKEKQIALWDVLKACEREGSMDSAIRNPQPNEIADLVNRHPQLHTIFFNSQNAWKLFQKLVPFEPFENLTLLVLPSSSPARAMKFEDKLAQWSLVRERLEKGTTP